MAKDLNRFECIGRLGLDPDIRYTSAGRPHARLSVAVNRQWKDANGESQERTTWVRSVAWGKLAEICAEYLRKGSRIYLAGPLDHRQYQNAEGQTQYITEIVMNEMQMLDGKPNGEPHANPPPTPNNPPPDMDDDIPF